MDCSPPGSSVHGDSPGKNTGVGCYALPPGDLPNPGTDSRSPTLKADSLLSEPPGEPKNTGVGSLSLLQGIFPTAVSCIAGGFFTSWARKVAQATDNGFLNGPISSQWFRRMSPVWATESCFWNVACQSQIFIYLLAWQVNNTCDYYLRYIILVINT